MLKRKLSYLLVVGFVFNVVFSVASFAFDSPQKAYAAPQGFDVICVPPTTLQQGLGYKPNGWLTLEIINRAQIKVTISPTGDCANQNRSMDSVVGETPGKMKPLLEEVLMDVNISDDTWGFRSFVDGFSGDGIRDQTYLKAFTNSALKGAKDSFGGQDALIPNVASIFTTFSEKTELVFGVEPTAFANLIGTSEAKAIAKTADDTCTQNGNIALFDENGYKWDCTSRTADKKGVIAGGTFKNIENFNIIYNASTDGFTLSHVSRNLDSSRTFRWCAAENFTQPNGEKGRYRTNCSSTTSGLYLEGPNANPKTMTEKAARNDIEVTVREQGNNSPGYKVLVAGSGSTSTQASNGGGAGTGLGGVDQDVEPTCETNGGLSWIICPIINGLTSASQGIFENVIEPYLKTEPLSTENSNDNTIFKIWSSFRTLGNIVLLFAILFVVFGQAIGGGLVDAYTAKKAMPRILIVAILINISYYLSAIMIDVTNVIGAGIGTLITAPLRASDAYNFSIGGGTAGNLTAIVGVGAFLAWVISKINTPTTVGGGNQWAPQIAGTQGIINQAGSAAGTTSAATAGGGGFLQFFLLFIFLPIVLITISIFATLIIRRGLIIFLVIIAPIALALYCLPQTEKYAKKWFDTFVKTLMVYPIIVAIFSIAYVLALTIIAGSGGSSDGTFSQFLAKIIGLIVLFVPLAMIPFAFKLAGGAVASLYGAINGFGKKGNEMFKGDARNPDSLRNRVRRKARNDAINKGLTGGVIGARANVFNGGLGKTGRTQRMNRAAMIRNAQQQLLAKKAGDSEMFTAYSQSDAEMGMLAEFNSAKDARSYIDGQLAIGKIDQTRHTQLSQAIEAAEAIGWTNSNRRAAIMSSAAIGYHFAKGEAGWNDALVAMASISGTKLTTRQYTPAEIAADKTRAGKVKVIDGAETQAAAINPVFRAQMDEFQYLAKGAGRADLSGNTSGKFTYDAHRAWSSVGLYQQGNGKPKAIQAAADYYVDLATRASTATSEGDFDKAEIDRYTTEAKTRGMPTIIRTEPDGTTREIASIDAIRKIALEEAGAFAVEMGQIGQSGSGSARDEAIAQKARMDSLFGTTIGLDLSDRTSPLVNDIYTRARVMDTRDRGTGPGGPPP